jgi:hypothetical protein
MVVGIGNVQMSCDRAKTRRFKEASFATLAILMTSGSVSQHSLAVTGTGVNPFDFVVVSISYPKVILGILNAQTVLEPNIKPLTIDIAKTKEFTTTAYSSHW